MTRPIDPRSAPLKLALGMAITGTVGAFGIQSGQDAITIAFWRSIFGTAFLLAWCFAFRLLPTRTLSRQTLLLSAAGGSCLVLSWAGFFAGLKLTTIATATIVMHVQPFIVVLLGALFLKERLTLDQLLWIMAAFVGLILASGIGLAPGAVDDRWLTGLAFTLGAALCYAIAAMVGTRLSSQRPEVTTLCQAVMGILIFLPFVSFDQPIAVQSWFWLVGIGVLHTGIAWVIIYSALPAVSTPVVAVLSFVYPIVAIIIDWAIYGHALGPFQGAGMALIAIAILGVRLGWRLLPSRRNAFRGQIS